jgi:LysR family transcriptional regulator, nitrogen assimilation regulatory protein
MDLRRLTHFVQIAEAGSLSKAADKIRIAQPALSRQMRLLENTVGIPLFNRHRRGVQLTREGEELRSRLVGPLRQIELAIEDTRSLSKEISGNVAFGMPPTTSYVLAGPLARRVAQHAPNVSLRVVEGYQGHLIDWLQRGEIDVALLYGPASDYRLKAQDLLVEELVLVGPPDCGLSPDTPVPFAQLGHLPLVLPSHPNGLRVVVDTVATRTRTPLRFRFQADSFVLLKELVASGLGYATLPYSSFSREATDGSLRYAPIIKPKVTRQLVLGRQPGADPSRATLALEALVRHELAALVSAGKWNATLQFDVNSVRGCDAA